MYSDEIGLNVSAGAYALDLLASDELIPIDWHLLIDTTNLNMVYTRTCILGQLFNQCTETPPNPLGCECSTFHVAGYEYAQDVFYGVDADYDFYELGFSCWGHKWDELQEAWIHEIANRMHDDFMRDSA